MSEPVDERLRYVNTYKTDFTLTYDMSADWAYFIFIMNMRSFGMRKIKWRFNLFIDIHISVKRAVGLGWPSQLSVGSISASHMSSPLHQGCHMAPQLVHQVLPRQQNLGATFAASTNRGHQVCNVSMTSSSYQHIYCASRSTELLLAACLIFTLGLFFILSLNLIWWRCREVWRAWRWRWGWKWFKLMRFDGDKAE